MKRKTLFNKTYNLLLSEASKEKAEIYIVWISIASFVIHLALIFLARGDLLHFESNSKLLQNPISAIYTPFSFILLFEVYLLVYHIPHSTTNYVAKQYEIITLIVVRRLFKDIANIDLTDNWFRDAYDLQFTFDIITTLLLFLFIFYFHKLNQKEENKPYNDLSAKVRRFVTRKRVIAVLLVVVVIALTIYSFTTWLVGSITPIFDDEA
ncbi:hypothetical protein E1176_00800, partial [Fulvivirga sp. RKSG066]|nr:hypothetical protein [Fulvivirga aurantia]